MLIPILASFAMLQLSPGSPAAPSPGHEAAGIKAAPNSSEGSEAGQLLAGTKRCPDGSILRTIDRCAEMPDHRFEITHEPARQARSGRWWCRGSPEASEVSVTIELRRPAGSRGPLTQVSRLDALVVNGRPASAELKKSVQQNIDSFHRFDSFGGRCLSVRPEGTVPVLTLHGVVIDQGKLGWKHEEIPLSR